VIGLVTDSNAQLPPELVERYAVEVVPLTVTVDGVSHLEGVDLDADAFYARFATGRPEVSTSQPGPALFTDAYARLVERGFDTILSIHIGSNVSGTVNSARVAADTADATVRIVDTGTASFGVACCVWEAAEAIAAGASLEQAAAAAERVGATVGNVFVVKALDLARAGGRLARAVEVSDAIPVLRLTGGVMDAVGEVRDLDEAAEVMASYVRAWGTGLRVGVGTADAETAPVSEALERRLAGAPEVLELVRYRIGPSVGAHTGPGTVGAVYYPAQRPLPRPPTSS
jgi:DegV family protein with EDD domain